MADKIRVTVWNEYRHEKNNPKVTEVYPKGIHEAIAEHLRVQGDLDVRTATLDEPSHGLDPEWIVRLREQVAEWRAADPERILLLASQNLD